MATYPGEGRAEEIVAQLELQTWNRWLHINKKKVGND